MKRSEPINELAAALSKAQKQFEAAERAHVAKVTSKKGEGSSYTFNYADLQAYLDVCREPLADNGLSFVQEPTCKGNIVSVTTLLMHSSGQWLESEPLELVLTGETLTPQVIGSGITYARRYSLSALTGMASEQDDDGNSASGNTATTGPREEKPACPKCGHNRAVIHGDEKYGGGWVCWKKKDGCGEKWQDVAHLPDAPPPKAEAGKLSKLDQTEIDNLRICFEKHMFNPANLTSDKQTRTKHATAVVAFCLPGKTWQDVANTPGIAAQVKESLFAQKDAGMDEAGIYYAAKEAAGLLTELDKQMAATI
jgi:hypothetical protein